MEHNFTQAVDSAETIHSVELTGLDCFISPSTSSDGISGGNEKETPAQSGAWTVQPQRLGRITVASALLMAADVIVASIPLIFIGEFLAFVVWKID